MSERKRQWVAIDWLNQHLLFILTTWLGLTGDKCVQEVTGQGRGMYENVSCVKRLAIAHTSKLNPMTRINSLR